MGIENATRDPEVQGRRPGFVAAHGVERIESRFAVQCLAAKLATVIGLGIGTGVVGAPAPNAAPTREPPAGAVALTAAPAQTVELTLPFAGIWGVLQGIDSSPTHVGYAAYALDFVPAERITSGPPPVRRRLQDFPCFGREVLAAAAGTVVWAEDGAEDGLPDVGASDDSARRARHRGAERRRRPRHTPGNFVIVQHAEAEFTEYRHLRSRSVRVVVGERVERGQPIGQCGNSGDAGTPHLHVGLLGSVEPIATRPMRFSRYEVLGSGGLWKPGDGVPSPRQILRSVVAPRREIGGQPR
jgi:Peptidase family M23